MNTLKKKQFNTGRSKEIQAGFTLVEVIAVLVILATLVAIATVKFFDFRKEAKIAALKSQAANLIANNTLNFATCKVNSSQCIDIRETGDAACRMGLDEFLPQVDTSIYGVANISSDTPENEWRSAMEDILNQLGKDIGAIFWIDRFLLTPPSQGWLDQGWNPRQPCVLFYEE